MSKKIKLEDQSELEIYTQEEFETWQKQLNDLQTKLTETEATIPISQRAAQSQEKKISDLEMNISDLTQKMQEAATATETAQAEITRLKAQPPSPPPEKEDVQKEVEAKKRTWV